MLPYVATFASAESNQRSSVPEIPDVRDVIAGELATNGNWIVANVQTSSYWPIASQKQRYRGVDVWILPIMKGFFPSVAMNTQSGRDRDECGGMLMQFLSALSWVQGNDCLVDGIGGGNQRAPARSQPTGLGVPQRAPP